MSAVSTVFGILIIVLLIPALLCAVYMLLIKGNQEKIQETMRNASLFKKFLFWIVVLLCCMGPTIALTYAGAHLIGKGNKSNADFVPYKKGGILRY